MGRVMGPDYPAFKKMVEAPPALDEETKVMYEMPVVRSIDDTRAIVSRLRYVMEDPGAQIASAGMPYVIDKLSSNGNRPDRVRLPGFTNMAYHTLPSYQRSSTSIRIGAPGRGRDGSA